MPMVSVIMAKYGSVHDPVSKGCPLKVGVAGIELVYVYGAGTGSSVIVVADGLGEAVVVLVVVLLYVTPGAHPTKAGAVLLTLAHSA